MGLAVAAAALALGGLAACSETGVSPADAYKIGCPALDAAAAGGSAVNSAGVTGLKVLRDSGQLGPEAQTWLEAAIAALESGRPEELPAEAKALLVDGCARNGYQLQNLG